MATQAGEAYLDWLEREEENIGFAKFHRGMEDIETARKMWFEQMGYEIKEGQFEALTSAMTTRYEELPTIGIRYERVEQAWGFQEIFRDIVTGRFMAKEDVFTLLATIR